MCKKIWNNRNTNKSKIKTKSSVNNKFSIVQSLRKKFNISIPEIKFSNVKKNKTKRKINKKQNIPFYLKLSEKLKTKFKLKNFLNFNLNKRINRFGKISKINSPISKIDLKNLSDFLPEKYSRQIQNLFKKIYVKNINKNSSPKISFSIKLLGISYVDNVLSIVYLERLNKKNIIRDIVNINIPGDLMVIIKLKRSRKLKE